MPLCLFIIACSIIFKRPPGYKSGAPGLFFILIITVIILMIFQYLRRGGRHETTHIKTHKFRSKRK